MKKKFELFEINCLIYFIMKASFMGIIINNIINISKETSYISVIIGSIIGILIVNLYIKISNIDSTKNINQNILLLFKDKIGKIIIFVLTLFIMSFGVLILYNVINFIISEYLYFTPNYIIGIILTIPIIYLVRHGIKVICRTSIILFFISLLLYILSILGLFGQIDFSNLFPIILDNNLSIIHGSFIYIAYTVLPIFLITIIPKDSIKDNNKYNKKIIKYYVFFSFICIISIIILIATLGVDLATLYKYPSYHMLGKIAFGGFIKRIQSLLALEWIICIYFMLVFINYYINDSLFYIFKIKNKNIFNYITPVLILYFSTIIFKNNTTSLIFEFKYYPYLLFVFLLIIPLIIYIVSIKKHKL